MSDINIRFKIGRDELLDLYQTDYARIKGQYVKRFWGFNLLILACLSVFLIADAHYALHRLGWWIPILIILPIFAVSRTLSAAVMLGKLKSLDGFVSAYRLKKWHGSHQLKLNKKTLEYRRDGKRKALYEWTDLTELRLEDTYIRLEWGEQAPPPVKNWETMGAVILSIGKLKEEDLKTIEEHADRYRPKYNLPQRIAYYKVL
ncbi:MAG: hypothetical protein AAFQ87_18695 [Bacteroidota bacterium]